MEYKIVDRIANGPQNARFLLLDEEQGYHSAKLPKEEYKVGDTLSGGGFALEPADQRWIHDYENKSGYPRKEMKEHLVKYKQEVLGDLECGQWKGSAKDHIFVSPERNLIGGQYDKEFLACIKRIKEKGELRDDFCHMTSSQAFAVNFFIPLIKEKRLSALGGFCDGVDYDACDFEVVKDQKEETHFDFYMPGLPGSPTVSVEVKYSENDFGKPKEITEKHHWKYDNIFGPNLKKAACIPIVESQLFEYYQIWRNILYTVVNPGQHICFLFPAFRADLNKPLEDVLSQCKQVILPYIHVIYADTVIDAMIAEGGALGEYYSEFKRKYLDF